MFNDFSTGNSWFLSDFEQPVAALYNAVQTFLHLRATCVSARDTFALSEGNWQNVMKWAMIPTPGYKHLNYLLTLLWDNSCCEHPEPSRVRRAPAQWHWIGGSARQIACSKLPQSPAFGDRSICAVMFHDTWPGNHDFSVILDKQLLRKFFNAFSTGESRFFSDFGPGVEKFKHFFRKILNDFSTGK